MVPYPYDWIAAWAAKYGIELSTEALADLVRELEQ